MTRGRLAGMSMAIAAVIAACGPDRPDAVSVPATPADLPPEAPAHEPDAGAPAPGPPIGPAPPPPPTIAAPRPVTGACLPMNETLVVRLEGEELKACVDTDADGVADRCARWDRTDGTLRGFADGVDVARPHAPIAFGPHPDPRLAVTGAWVEACPPDRACVKLMPEVTAGGDVTGVAADGAYRRLAIAVRDGSQTTGRVEVWDLAAGRLRTRLALRRLVEDTEYTFGARFVGSAVLAVASRLDNQHAQAVIYGVDGSMRGELANGSRYLELRSMFELAPGVLALLDLEAPGVPYAVYTQSVATGRVVRKFVVAMDMDGDDDDSRLHQVTPRLLAVTQWSVELRLDLLDLTTGAQARFLVPAC